MYMQTYILKLGWILVMTNLLIYEYWVYKHECQFGYVLFLLKYSAHTKMFCKISISLHFSCLLFLILFRD